MYLPLTQAANNIIPCIIPKLCGEFFVYFMTGYLSYEEYQLLVYNVM
jgi:hypothetical protein